MMPMQYTVIDNERLKVCTSADYNYIYDKVTGFFARWGKTREDDPGLAPGPEIMDIEIDTGCNGPTGKVCKFCYKNNTPVGTRMTFDTYKGIFDKLPKTVTQIAFGITNIPGPDHPAWDIFQYTRDNGVTPNTTINGAGLTPEIAKRLAGVLGAVAVSRYVPKDICYDAIQLLGEAGIHQVNIHQLVAEETYAQVLELFDDMESDPRLKNLNASVLLMLKPKGRGPNLNPLPKDKYKVIVDQALSRNLRVGFDSCSVPSFLRAAKDHPRYDYFDSVTDPCESGLFSLYVDVSGRVWPCSFGEDYHNLEPLDLTQIEDFSKDVWHSPAMERWRTRLVANDRECILWEL